MGFRTNTRNCDASHNLKVVGSNPTPATKFLRVIKRLNAALRGGVRVSTTRGSTVEARGAEGLHTASKSGACGHENELGDPPLGGMLTSMTPTVAFFELLS